MSIRKVTAVTSNCDKYSATLILDFCLSFVHPLRRAKPSLRRGWTASRRKCHWASPLVILLTLNFLDFLFALLIL